VRFNPDTPEFTVLTITPFAAIQKISAYHAKFLRISWTYLDLLCRFGRRIGDDYPNICLAIAQVLLLWQPVKFGGSAQTSPGTTFALGFDSGFDDHEATFKRLNGNNRLHRVHLVEIW